MAFLSQNSSDTPYLFSLMNVLFWVWYDFPISFSGRNKSRKFFGRYGDLTNQYEIPLSRMLLDILEDDHIQWHPPLIRNYTNFWHFTDLDLINESVFLPNCVRFPWNICNGCGKPTEDAYSSGQLVLSHFGTCMCSNVETNFSWTCLVPGL